MVIRCGLLVSPGERLNLKRQTGQASGRAPRCRGLIRVDHDRAGSRSRDEGHAHRDSCTPSVIHGEVQVNLGCPIDQRRNFAGNVVMASGCGRIISDTRPGVKVCWILVTSCALVDSLDAEPEGALAIKTHHHGCRSSAFEHIGRRWVVGQVAVVVGPGHARRLRDPWDEIAHTKISRCCGGRKENSGYSEGSDCRLAVAGHDFPLRGLKLIESRAGARDWQLSPNVPRPSHLWS